MNNETPKKEEKGTKPRVGIVNFERRRHPRFTIDLPIEYRRIDSSVSQPGRVVNASEGGLLLYLPERMEVGQHLRIAVFFTSGAVLKTIECRAEVVWTDLNLGEGWGDYRSGVKFVDISKEDFERLKGFLKDLAQK